MAWSGFMVLVQKGKTLHFIQQITKAHYHMITSY